MANGLRRGISAPIIAIVAASFAAATAPGLAEQSAPSTRSTTSLSSADDPKMALHAGKLFIVWSTDVTPGPEGDVFGQRLRAVNGAPLGTEIQINTSTQGRQSQPMVAALTDGTFVAVWYSTQLGGIPGNIFGQRFSATGAKLGSEFQIDSAPVRILQIMPTVAPLAGGGFVVAWVTYDNNRTTYDVRGQIFRANGSKAGLPFFIADAKTSEVSPDIGPMPDGGFVVSWVDELIKPRVMSVLRAQRFDNKGVKVGDQLLLENQNGRVTTLADGSLVAVWTVFDPVTKFGNVHAQHFSSDGTKVGPELQPDPRRAKNETSPDLAPIKSGGFVIVWNQGGRDICGGQYSAHGKLRGLPFCTNALERGTVVGNPAVVPVGPNKFALAFRMWTKTTGWGVTAGILDLNEDAVSTPSFSVLRHTP